MDFTHKIINNKYEIKAKIGEGGMSTVWLAEDIQKKENYAIKILKKYATSNRVENIIRFRNEATTVSKLNVPSIVKIIELGEIENTSYIVMEYIKGCSLQTYIHKDGPTLNLNDIIEIIAELSEALKYIHNANIIHRDLKPGNILVNITTSEKLEVKLIDFGFSQVKEFNFTDIEGIIGTLAYMSPEQSGIIKKSIDERSDLYSIGIIFYQLLTKELPFNGTNINSILHQQIAKTPDPPNKYNHEVPNVINRIVLKLLEKEPEKRYQSAAGLLSDLEKYKREKTDFMIGLDDKHVKLSYRTNLIGRSDELTKLRSLYDDALNGNGRICLISGEAGMGKTRLVEELRDYIFEKNGTYLYCKCFSGKNKIPYGPFKDVTNMYTKNFNQYSDDQKKHIKEYLKVTLDELGGIVLKLNSVLDEIIEYSPPLIELDAEKENKRFLMIISQFIYSLGHIENALVIVIDDMQWIDDGSFELLNEIVKEVSKHPILIIATYRNNEVLKDHNLKNFIENAKANNYPLHKIFLSLFDIRNMNKFISGLLFNDMSGSKEITDFIYKKSKGNPFFAIEILKQLISAKVLIRSDEKWIINKNLLRKIEVPSSIVNALIKKISTLSAKEINVLSYAAVIGKKFNMELLFSLTGLDKEEVVKLIDQAIDLQLVEEINFKSGEMIFSHDRVKEAFYRNIDEKIRKQLHCKIAKHIEYMDPDNIQKYIFDLAYHYTEAGNKDKILEYAYPAAIKYKENYANEEALEYLMLEKKLLIEKNEIGHNKWINIMENIGDIYLTIGKYDDSIEVFNEILPYLKTTLRKANTYKQISTACFKKGDWTNCEEYARQGLILLKENIPFNQIQVNLFVVKELFARFYYSTVMKFSKSNETLQAKKEYRKIIEFHHILARLYTLIDIYKCTYTTLRMLNLADSKLGKSKELGMSLGVYASYTLTGINLFNQAIKHHEKALALKKDLKDELGYAQSLQLLGFCYELCGEYNKSIDAHKQSIEIFKKIGDIGETAISKSSLSSLYYYFSEYSTAKALNEEYFDIAIKSKDVYGMVKSWEKSMIFFIEEGDFEKAEYYGIKAYDMSLSTSNWLDYCVTSAYLGVLALERKEFAKAIDYLEKAKDIHEKNSFMKQYTVFIYYYLAEAYIANYSTKKDKISKKDYQIMLRKIYKLCNTACKKTFSCITYHCGSTRVLAKYYALIKKYKKAEKLFKYSIDIATKLNRKYELGKSLLDFGLFLEGQEMISLSKETLEKAYNVFKNIGAKTYEKRVADLLGIVENDISVSEHFQKELRYSQRLSSIINISQGISSILNLDELLEKIMTVAIQIAGAQKGYLIMQDEKTKEFIIKVRKNIEDVEIGKDDFSKTIVEQVFESGKAVLTTNAMEDEKFHTYQSVLYNQLKSVLCIPIQYNNEVKGVCYLSNPLSSGVFTEEELDVLKAILTQAAISIENAKLYRLAITDGLTELITHKHFKFLLNKEVENSRKNNSVFSLMMFDVDHFKVFNDTYGHQVGDLVLVNVSRILKEESRTLDTIARYGGEEFIIILPETDQTGAETVGERLRSIIENLVLKYNDHSLKVTVSAGIAIFPYHADKAEALIKSADEALYLSKEAGRNKVTVAEYKK